MAQGRVASASPVAVIIIVIFNALRRAKRRCRVSRAMAHDVRREMQSKVVMGFTDWDMVSFFSGYFHKGFHKFLEVAGWGICSVSGGRTQSGDGGV